MVLNSAAVCRLAITASLTALAVMSRGMISQIAAMASASARGIGRTRRHARLLPSQLRPRVAAGGPTAASDMGDTLRSDREGLAAPMARMLRRPAVFDGYLLGEY